MGGRVRIRDSTQFHCSPTQPHRFSLLLAALQADAEMQLQEVGVVQDVLRLYYDGKPTIYVPYVGIRMVDSAAGNNWDWERAYVERVLISKGDGNYYARIITDDGNIRKLKHPHVFGSGRICTGDVRTGRSQDPFVRLQRVKGALQRINANSPANRDRSDWDIIIRE